MFQTKTELVGELAAVMIENVLLLNSNYISSIDCEEKMRQPPFDVLLSFA